MFFISIQRARRDKDGSAVLLLLADDDDDDDDEVGDGGDIVRPIQGVQRWIKRHDENCY